MPFEHTSLTVTKDCQYHRRIITSSISTLGGSRGGVLLLVRVALSTRGAVMFVILVTGGGSASE